MTQISTNQTSPPVTAGQPAGSVGGHGAPTLLLASTGRIVREADKNVGAPARAFWLPVILVLLAEGIAIVAFYGLEWSWLRQMHVLWLQTTLQALACSVQTGVHSLTVNGHAFQISPDCTYVDLVICSLPLLWRIHRRFSTNLAVLAAFAAAIVVVNLVRVLYGVYAYSHGVSMFWSHDMVDYILWYPIMGTVALLWLRSLGALWNPKPRSSRGNEALTAIGESEIRKQKAGVEMSLVTSAATGTRNEATA